MGIPRVSSPEAQGTASTAHPDLWDVCRPDPRALNAGDGS